MAAEQPLDANGHNPPAAFRSWAWRRCIKQVGQQATYRLARSIPGVKLQRPWMKSREIDLICEVLKNLRPQRCLEWGSGYSTLFYPSVLPSTSTWRSVEHDRAWAEEVARLNQRTTVTVHHVEPNRQPWSDSRGDGTAEDLADYIAFPGSHGPYDFILVDGRARCDCVQKAMDLVTDDGVVVLHDANRTWYEPSWKDYPHQAVFRDYRTTVGGLWFGGLSPRLFEVFDHRRQAQLWDLYRIVGPTAIGKLLRI